MDSAESSDEESDSESKGNQKKKENQHWRNEKNMLRRLNLNYVRSMGTVTPLFSTPFGLK